MLFVEAVVARNGIATHSTLSKTSYLDIGLFTPAIYCEALSIGGKFAVVLLSIVKVVCFF